MTDEQIQTAQRLVKQKQYVQAQAYLKSIGDDPQAKEWLTVLANIPPDREGKREYHQTEWRPNRYILAGILIFCFYFFARDTAPVILRWLLIP